MPIPLSDTPVMPPRWRDRLAGYAWAAVHEGASAAQVYRLTCDDAPGLFVKREPQAAHAELGGEMERLAWLQGRGVPCPQPLDLAQHEGALWLLMSALPGCTLASAALPAEQAVMLYVQALHRLHALPPAACPFDMRLARRISEAGVRAAAGLVDEDDFDEARRGQDALALHAQLCAEAPACEDPVVTHGDATLENLVAAAGRFSGFIDCGRLGVADRYQDLALACRSLADAYGETWADRFLSAYGIAQPDRHRLAFYTLLDEFF
ncbi:aminoglycoside 3'-phosphotransferase [Chitiniphilus purpureus]|uniref:Aminoglycoside 3'-phosphotransferase n=1 Tax=Chitiniphilus purpureus TaxID=2981137 RepID=A0ABY6DI91_9NEIS|nr:APH(3') family aminoglycoside O-phosphotransferase [Chitiniphilus sp. CD1]UXY14069.1 aminoglycoside 3'-phosphotransferase [Chitiniphilus sp. CD1]